MIREESRQWVENHYHECSATFKEVLAKAYEAAAKETAAKISASVRKSLSEELPGVIYGNFGGDGHVWLNETYVEHIDRVIREAAL